MPLDPTQLAYVQRYAGTQLDSATLDAIYDSALEGNSDVNYTVYYALLTRRNAAWDQIAQTTPNTGFTLQAQMKYDHLDKMLSDWGTRFGIGGQSLTAGVIDLDTDLETCWDAFGNWIC